MRTLERRPIVRHPSELHAQFLSNNSMDPWVDVNSGPRKVMYAGHLPQALVIHGSEERYWQTGAEARFGEYCFSVKAPSDIEIIRKIERFPRSRVLNTTIKNPQTVVIYLDLNTRQVGCLDLRDYSLEHQYFGFNYRKTEAYHRIEKGACFEEGTEFLVSPSLREGGGWAYGLNLMFASMSLPQTADDGIFIGQSALKKMSFNVIESRVGSWGQNRFPVNLHGNDSVYKCFPDVGERIRPDGLLMATREIDDRLAVTSLGLYDTQMLDMMYDEKLYTRAGDGIVKDIMVYHDNRSLPNGMSDQVERYKDLTDRFYREILEEYNNQLRLRRSDKRNNWLTDEFHRLVLEAAAMTDFDIGDVVQKLYHKAPIDDWRVEFKIEYTIVPNIGNKATGCAGDKGVVCYVLPDDQMPVNEFGTRVDVVMSTDSPVNRQNSGALYEPYFNQVTREFLVTVRDTIKMGPDDQPTPKQILEDMPKQPEAYEDTWSDLMRLYEILSPTMHEYYTSMEFDDPAQRAVHMSWLLRSPCIHILSPTHNMTAWRHAYKACQAEFAPRVGRMWYTDLNGERVLTEEPVECGHKYFMVLEKISDDWIATNTAKVQHLQLLGQVTSSDKHAGPVKNQAVKAISEAEMRIILSYSGGQVAADLMDRNNSLPTHREYVYSIMDSETPTNIERGVDRNLVPLGNNRALKLFKHILECIGYKFVHEEYIDPKLGDRDLYIDKDRENMQWAPWAPETMKSVRANGNAVARVVKQVARRTSDYVRRLFNKEG